MGDAEKISGLVSLDVLISARNEEVMIAETIASIRNSIESAQNSERIRIIVGVDSSNDRTAELAALLADEAIEFHDHKSKWKTLHDLVQRSQAEWVALVDVGTVWPRMFLRRFEVLLDRSDIYAFAPGYRVGGVSKISTSVLWGFERWIKRIENFAGGPVSVHGATVLYRREPLLQVLSVLSSRRVWYNDDVVVPLVLRACFKEARILYSSHPDVIVEDQGVVAIAEAPQKDMRRRLRLAIGNIQWMTSLLRWVFAESPRAGVLGLRRLFRVFWAWWIVLMFSALALELWIRDPKLASVVLLVLLVAGYVLRELSAAFMVSLIAPVLFFLDNRAAIKWK